MAFGEESSLNSSGGPFLKDYRHASKFFRSNGYENAPRLKFLYHVYFNINTEEIESLRPIFQNNRGSIVGMLVKNIQLPSYKIETDVLNQYNRKKIVQKKIEYDPVQVEFHDDGGDLIRSMWYYYYSYYYKDSAYQYESLPATNGAAGANSSYPNGFDYNARDTYVGNRTVNNWGYSGDSATGNKPRFFKDIRIYGFDQHKFAEYILINPVIQSWKHDTYDYSQDNGIMQHTVSIQYETVKYASGAIGNSRPDVNVFGFADPANYDQQPGPIFRV